MDSMHLTINGGSVAAFGSRNDAADSASAHPCMELSFTGVCDASEP